MRVLRWIMIICLISCLSIQMTFPFDNPNFEMNIGKDGDNGGVALKQISLEEHAPIRIQSDSEFASIALAEGWTGNGSSSNPYIIEDYAIRTEVIVTTDTIETQHAIHISDTVSSFVIRNCQLFNDTDSGDFWSGIGILLDNVRNCTIESTYFEGLGPSIDLDDCGSIEIVNCTITHEWGGTISVSACQNATVINNTVSGGGIGLGNSVLCNVSNNTVRGSISLSECDRCTIIDNAIEGGGLGVYGDTQYSHTIIGNTVGGLPISYYENLVDGNLDLSGIGQLILNNCTDIVAKNGYFDLAVGSVRFSFCTNCTLSDSAFMGTLFYLRNCASCTISNVTTYGAYESEVQFVTDCVIENCEFSGGEFNGFFIAHESYNCIVRNCSFTNNAESGLLLHHAHNNLVTNCTFMNNQDGIRNSIANDNIFTGNRIVDNQWSGLTLSQSSGCTVTENRIYDNGIGIAMSFSTENVIHSNEFGWNAAHVLFEGTSSNSWDNGIDQGNYWSGYDGEGALFLALGSQDNYPIPLLLARGPAQIVYQNGTTGHQIEWTCSAVHPASYAIYFGEDEIESGAWDGRDISVDIDGLSPGNYTFTLYLTEIYGHTESSSVEVIVTNGFETDTIPEPLVIILILVLISAVGVVVVVIIVYRFR